MTRRVYCIDTSVIINMHRDFRIDRFPSIWGKVSELIAEQRLFVHRQVFEEIQSKGTGACLQWKRSLPRECIIEMDDAQNAFIARMASEHAYLFDLFTKPEYEKKADPFLVAMGHLNGWCVVSDEGKKDWKIPSLCRRYGVDCVDKWGLMETEDWHF